ncbi:MAG TPA: addiction module protein [Opitutaceae bacterium]
MNSLLAAEINRLSSVEKLQLVEELSDQLAACEDNLPVPAWHKKVLAEDQAAYLANPAEGSSWADVKARITGKA